MDDKATMSSGHTGQLHVGTHGGCDRMCKTCRTQARPSPSVERGAGYTSPPLAVGVTVNYWRRERQL